MHFKRTLAQFSLENKVSLVTGGARGLGLVMSQALVASGSDLAIVDLNRKFRRFIATDGFQEWQLMCHREGS
jgi:NAD(P)-dependent dehydrogenase (short-subunit alcohol dehydrogenase family)